MPETKEVVVDDCDEGCPCLRVNSDTFGSWIDCSHPDATGNEFFRKRPSPCPLIKAPLLVRRKETP